jgi:hypothetical protein
MLTVVFPNHQYDRWYVNTQVEGALDVATEMALSTFSLSATEFPHQSVSKEMRREGAISPYSEAAKALRTIICHSPQHFISNQAIAALGAGWEASYAASNCPGILNVEDRQALCVGICHVLASLPDNQRGKSLHALAMPTLDCLETMTRHADHAAGSSSSEEELYIVLDRIADEIKVLTTMARTFTNAFYKKDASMESGCRTSDGHAAIVEPAFAILHKAWPSISHVASKYNHNEVCHVAYLVADQFLVCQSLSLKLYLIILYVFSRRSSRIHSVFFSWNVSRRNVKTTCLSR